MGDIILCASSYSTILAGKKSKFKIEWNQRSTEGEMCSQHFIILSWDQFLWQSPIQLCLSLEIHMLASRGVWSTCANFLQKTSILIFLFTICTPRFELLPASSLHRDTDRTVATERKVSIQKFQIRSIFFILNCSTIT